MEEVRNPEEDLKIYARRNDGYERLYEFYDMTHDALPWYIQQYQQMSEQLQTHQTKPEYELGYINGSNATFQRVKELLKQLEWSASEEQWDENYDGDWEICGTSSVCPICRCQGDSRDGRDGHSADCTLAKLLYNHGETEVDK
jgi:hypothetical protein